MLARPIVHDALWRCLCPSFPSHRATAGLVLVGSGAVTRHRRPRAASRCPPLRAFSGATEPESSPYLSPAGFGARTRLPTRANAPSGHGKPALVHLQTAELYERLRREGAAGKHEDVMNIVRILIKDRRERPNSALYAAVLHSYVNAEEGTAGKVRRVLDEMAEDGVELDARGCHCVLETLAVHPDYLLRNEILEYMRERWFSLSARGHNMVVAGLLRDRLFEQALEKIGEMVSQRVQVEGWLWDKTMWLLLDYGEIEEAYQTLLLRQNNGNVKLTTALWTHFLDCAAQIEAVNLTWHSQVIPGYLKPATGTCLKILTLAGRRGQVKLATDVFRVLSERETVFDIHTYEGLMEAYTNAQDLNAALSVAIIMHESALKVSADSIGPIYFFLVQNHSRPMEAFSLLQNFESSGRKVPVAAVNVCLQACVHLKRLEEAIEIYKALHTVCKTGPNTQTFNILFQGCHKAARKELAMFLASEMTQLGLKPDRITYDRLVLVCTQSNDLEDAMLYYEEMRGQGYDMRRGTFEMVIKLGVSAGDARMPAVLRDMYEAGFTPSDELVRSVKMRFEDPPVHESLSGVEGGVAGPRVQDALMSEKSVDSPI
ncbi:hypothetical protein K505DRAFT_293900 [Melanomma pulvis-pyrius CBS 109.77]|uniref:Pentatricopeptide repeat-containing protein-mitochondrial domain-containing protein n=1 Tax=Melanomma pulvis-pyrius CBS 109.77 TaxID=1314802 RepID=A0A6A6XUE6_9PLEO|nr:hypothetical protein K505DRAFT_293900 [Melanomma pulvis-pyrius CBS 109.77]